MESPPYQDLVGVDRDVARAHAALTKWCGEVSNDPEAHGEREPLEPVRHVAGRAAYLAVRGEADSSPGAETPLREALGRWVAHLTLARVGHDLDVKLASAKNDVTAHFVLGEGRKVSWRDAWRALVRAEAPAEAAAWLDAAAERGGAIAAIVRERASQREEVATRLGLPGTWALATRVPRATLEAAAEELFVSTRAIWRDVLKDARLEIDSSQRPSPLDALRVAVARNAPEGWPAHLAPRWLVEVFPRLADGLRVDLGALPPVVGASSFARALGAFGHALRVAGPARSLPFALARDPSFADAHRFAGVFASLASSVSFQRRALGNSSRVAAAQARTVARSLLFSARLDAARVVLASSPDRFDELTYDLLGTPLPRALAGAWPASRDDEPARILALLTTLPLSAALVERFDVDWFLNPRAASFLRARASGPAWDDGAELDSRAPRTLARALEEAVA